MYFKVTVPEGRITSHRFLKALQAELGQLKMEDNVYIMRESIALHSQ